MISFLRKRQKFLIAVLIFLTFLHFLSNRLQKKQLPNIVDKLIILLSSPLQSIISVVSNYSSYVVSSYLLLVNTKYEYNILLLENQSLKEEIEKLREIKIENSRLNDLLDIKNKHPLFTLVAASIIAKSESGFGRTVRINKGTMDNIIDNLAVINNNGAVGRTLRVTKYYSDVLLITDPNSSTDSLCQRSRTNGIIKGTGDSKLLDMVYVEREEDIQLGDVIITSGFEEIWPKGVNIGEVIHAEKKSLGLFQNVEVAPYVDFSKLEDVLVVIPNADNRNNWEDNTEKTLTVNPQL